jgi:hypothetical protein
MWESYSKHKKKLHGKGAEFLMSKMAVRVLTTRFQRVRNMHNPMEKSYSASVQKV